MRIARGVSTGSEGEGRKDAGRVGGKNKTYTLFVNICVSYYYCRKCRYFWLLSWQNVLRIGTKILPKAAGVFPSRTGRRITLLLSQASRYWWLISWESMFLAAVIDRKPALKFFKVFAIYAMELGQCSILWPSDRNGIIFTNSYFFILP